jgi:hypothetical protein
MHFISIKDLLMSISTSLNTLAAKTYVEPSIESIELINNKVLHDDVQTGIMMRLTKVVA